MKVKTVMVERATRSVCIVAATLSLIITWVRTSSLQSSDLPFLALIIAPYLLLGLMAGSVSNRSTFSRILFIATLLLSLGGLAVLSLSSPHTSTGPEPGLVQSVIMIGVPLLQLVGVAMFGLVLLLRRMITSA